MIRFILVCIVVIGYLILSIPILLVEWIIGKFSSYDKRCQLSPDHPGSISLHPLDYRCQSHSDRRRKCAKDTPVLYIGNHRSYFDILLTYSRCPIAQATLPKRNGEIPLLSTWMHYLHCLFLDRKDIKQGLKTILTAVDKVKSGISICIFPGRNQKQEPGRARYAPIP